MTTRVLKFGGSTFCEATDYRIIAKYLKNENLTKGTKFVVVVSGPEGGTEYLRELSSSLCSSTSNKAIEELLAQSDTFSMALLRVAVSGVNLHVTSLCGFQAGLLSQDTHIDIKKLIVDSNALFNALENHDVVVIPGGQGVSKKNELLWFGKNSSDLSAIVFASELGVNCEIFSDVCGIYSADPNIIQESIMFDNASFDFAYTLTTSGAKVIHQKAIAFARHKNVPILCRSNKPAFRSGTLIGNCQDENQFSVVLDLNSVTLMLNSKKDQDKSFQILKARNVCVVKIHQNDSYFLSVSNCFPRVREYLIEKGTMNTEVANYVLITTISYYKVISRKLVKRNNAIQDTRDAHKLLLAKHKTFKKNCTSVS